MDVLYRVRLVCVSLLLLNSRLRDMYGKIPMQASTKGELVVADEDVELQEP